MSDCPSKEHEIDVEGLPESTKALLLSCRALMLRGEPEEALGLAEAAVRSSPEDANTHYLKGGILSIVGNLASALDSTLTALRLDPTHAGAYGNLGAIYMWQHQYELAVRAYRRALELKPNLQEAQSGLAYSLLAQGQFEAGWAQHERSRPLGVLRYNKAVPRIWNGEAMPTGTLTIFCEEGMGDALQFCRLVPLARQRVGKVVIFLQPYFQPLERVLRTLKGADEVTLDAKSLHRCNACISMFSLPFIFNSSMLRSQAGPPYLHADPALAQKWRSRLREHRRFRVGIVWAGNPRLAQAMLNVIDGRRSIPLSALAPLLKIPNVTFYSLQKGEAAQQLRASALAADIIDFTDELSDFADTAALMTELDLVITVDTSTVHLAGALNRPVWMLNRFDTCWRWGPDREDAPWYPSLRIFRQSRFGDWATVVAKVGDELRHAGQQTGETVS